MTGQSLCQLCVVNLYTCTLVHITASGTPCWDRVINTTAFIHVSQTLLIQSRSKSKDARKRINFTQMCDSAGKTKWLFIDVQVKSE